MRSLEKGMRRKCSGVRKLIRKVQMSPTNARKWKTPVYGKFFILQVQHLAVHTGLSCSTHLLGFKRKSKVRTKASLMAVQPKWSHRATCLKGLCMLDIMLC